LGRRILEAIASAATDLNPLVFRIGNGRLTLVRPAHGDITFTHIRVIFKASDEDLALRASGRSSLTGAFDLRGRFMSGSLESTGRIEFTGLDTTRLDSLGLVPPTVPLPAMTVDLKMNFTSRALKTLQCGFQMQAPQAVVRNGLRRLTVKNLFLEGDGHWAPEQFRLSVQQLRTVAPALQLSGTADWPVGNRHSMMPADVRFNAVDLSIPAIRTAALQLAGDAHSVQNLFEILQGGKIPVLNVTISGIKAADSKTAPDVRIKGRLSAGRIMLPHDLLHLEQVSGRVVLDHGRLVAKDARARLGNSFARDGTLELGLFDGSRAFNLDAAVDADLSELAVTLKRVSSSRNLIGLLDRLPPLGGRATGRLRLGDNLDRITTRVSAAGRLNALDAALNVSGTITVPSSAGPVFGLSFNGPVGPRAVAWLGDFGGVSANWLPKAPVTVSQARIDGGPSDGYRLDGRFSLTHGLLAKAALRIQPDNMVLGTLKLKDAVSDAVVEYQGSWDGRKWQAGFTGNLEKYTVDQLLRRNDLVQGGLKGDLQIRYQAGAPVYDAVKGYLEFRQINAPADSSIPLRLLSGKVAGNGRHVDLSSVGFEWLDSTVRLSGNGNFTSDALNLDLTLSTDRLDADKLTQLFERAKSSAGPPAPDRRAVLPITGMVRVAAGRMNWKDYRFAPFQATADLSGERINVDLTEARLCGINIPGRIRFDQGRVQLNLEPRAVGAALQDTDQCLARTSITERLQGTVNVDGTIESHGRSAQEVFQNLAGRLDVQISDGGVHNVGAAGFFTNLLSFISVNQLIEGGLPDLRRDDFHYKSLRSKLTLKDSVLHIEEGALKSNSVNIVASGDYALATKKLNLVLLVSPLTTVDWIIERIPVLGNILQGTLVAVPVGVMGPVANPTVIPLSPAAVGSRLGGILKRTIKTPFRILSPLLKDKSTKDQ
jgi:AsmA-like C-terminal region